MNYGIPGTDISVSEAYGGPSGWPCCFGVGNQKIEYVIGRGSSAESGFFAPKSSTLGLYDNFHVYSFEWDENFLTWYIDGVQMQKMYRYFLFSSPFWPLTSCSPSTGVNYAEQPYWPYAPSPLKCQMYFNFEDFIDKDAYASTTTGSTIGSIKVDWVRVWQKYPDTPQHYDLCNRFIAGASSFCDASNHVYNVAGPGAAYDSLTVNWHWSVSPNLVIVGTPTMNSVTVKANMGSFTSSAAWVKHTDDNPICPDIVKNINVGLGAPPKPIVCQGNTTHTSTGGGTMYSTTFSINNASPLTTYNWHITSSYGSLTTTGNYVTFSQHPYYGAISISVYATNACGTSATTTSTARTGCGMYRTANPPVIYPSKICTGNAVNYISDLNQVPGMSFQWYKSLDNGLSFNSIEGATNAIYISPTPSPLEQLFYIAIDSNDSIPTETISDTTQISIFDTLQTISTNVAVDTIAGGDTLNLSVLSPDSNLYYTWNGGNIQCLKSDCTLIYDIPSESMTYTVTATNLGGCRIEKQIGVIVKPAPELTIIADHSTVCSGQTVTLNVENPIPGVTYSWAGGNILCANSSCAVATDIPTTTTTYSAIATSLDGSHNMRTITVDVDTPLLEISADYSKLCKASVISLNAIPWDANSTYTWSGGNIICSNIFCTSASDTILLDSVRYTATVTNLFGCKSIKSITVYNNVPVQVSFNVDRNTVCSGESVLLTVDNPDCASTYIWSGGGVTCIDESCLQSTDIPGIATTYTLTTTDPNGCVGSTSRTVNVNSHTPSMIMSDKPNVCPNELFNLFVVSPDPASSYEFSGGNLLCGPSCFSATGSELTTSTYQLFAINANGCVDHSDITIYTDICLGGGERSGGKVSQNSQSGLMRMFPNPTAGNIILNGILASKQCLSIEVIDVVGRLIYSVDYQMISGEFTKEIEINKNIINGLYLIKVKTENQSYNFHFILQR